MNQTLGEVCSFISGGTPARANAEYYRGNIPWITGADILDDHVSSGRYFITKQAVQSSATSLAPRGTVLLVTRTSVGKVAVAAQDLCFSQDITALEPDQSRLDSRYLLYFLQSRSRQLRQSARGATIKGITRRVVASLQIPLPPLDQQRRLADTLDRAHGLRANRRTALAQLDTLTQSIFLGMFGDPETNPRRWEIRPIKDYVADFVGGRSVQPEDGNARTMRSILKISAVTTGRFLANEVKPVSDAYRPQLNHFVRVGDFLFSRANTAALVGAVAIVRECPPNLLLPDKLWRFVWKEPATVDPYFTWMLFRSRSVRRALADRATGTGGSMKNISQAKLREIKTIVPPLKLQREFSEIAQRVEMLRVCHDDALTQLNTLVASLQHQAFEAEL